jgi:hypothetical protein
MFYLQLGELGVGLSSNSEQILAEWHNLYSRWPDFRPDPAYPEVEGRPAAETLIRVGLTAVDELPPLPATRPFFTDTNHPTPAGPGRLSVYKSEPEVAILSWQHVAQAIVSWQAEPSTVTGHITRAALRAGYLEDVLYTGLAPLLRRRGYYLVHAFAASYQGRALLLAGPSGSGKTTAGLVLIGSGWGYLGNDLVLLHQRPDAVYAYPMPDSPLIRSGSVPLLPWLKESNTPLLSTTEDHRFRMGIRKWAAPAPIAAVVFPVVTPASESRLTRAKQAVSLAYLLKQSLDIWDQASMDSHTALLAGLCRQAKGYHLSLGLEPAVIASQVAALVAEAGLPSPIGMAPAEPAGVASRLK